MKQTIITSVFLSLSAFAQAQQTDRPNIIFFLVDDMGWQETSVPFYKDRTELNDIYHTPNMERLAERGMKFTQAYACPLSSPTRISIMTGQNAMRHRVTNWTLFKNTSPDRYYKSDLVEVPDWNVNGMACETGVERTVYVKETLPSILREAGYRTIHVGKAHWGARETPGADPTTLGFDVNIAGHAAGGPGSYYGTNNFSAAFRNGGAEWDIPGLDRYHGKDINLTEALTIEASKEVERAVAENQPFYLYMSHYAIHAPWEPDLRFLDKYMNMGISEFQAKYASMLESMDKSLGDLMALVRRLGIEDNTIIIFMSDNGQPSQSVRNEPLRGHKISPYEGGIRVPMIVDIPGMTKAGSECHQPVIIEDIFPTILSLAHASSYKDADTQVDGVDITPFFRGKKIKGYQDRIFYWHYPHIYDQYPYSVIRKGDYKLIYRYDKQSIELYNIKDDISEKQNLATKEPQIRKELLGLLKQQLVDTHADIPISKKTGKAFEIVDLIEK